MFTESEKSLIPESKFNSVVQGTSCGREHFLATSIKSYPGVNGITFDGDRRDEYFLRLFARGNFLDGQYHITSYADPRFDSIERQGKLGDLRGKGVPNGITGLDSALAACIVHHSKLKPSLTGDIFIDNRIADSNSTMAYTIAGRIFRKSGKILGDPVYKEF